MPMLPSSEPVDMLPSVGNRDLAAVIKNLGDTGQGDGSAGKHEPQSSNP